MSIELQQAFPFTVTTLLGLVNELTSKIIVSTIEDTQVLSASPPLVNVQWLGSFHSPVPPTQK